MKKLIPYAISYLIVTAGILVFHHFTRHTHTSPYPPYAVIVDTALPRGELVAKLQQVGLSEATIQTQIITVRPAPIFGLVTTFMLYAVIFAAFAGLTILFQRALSPDVTSNNREP